MLPIGKAKVQRAGKDVTLVAFSKMVGFCLQAAEQLAKEGIDAEVSGCWVLGGGRHEWMRRVVLLLFWLHAPPAPRDTLHKTTPKTNTKHKQQKNSNK